MSRLQCLVQAASPAEQNEADLTELLRSHHGAHFPDRDVHVGFRTVDAGAMFTEGRQSTSSIISCTLPGPTTLAFREQYMRGVCDLWMDTTGCTEHEIVVSITEIDQPSED